MTDLSSNILGVVGAGSVTSIALAALLLRVALGGLFLAHAYLKYFIFTPKGAAGYFASLGVPGWFAYLTIAAETLGGIALIVGFRRALLPCCSSQPCWVLPFSPMARTAFGLRMKMAVGNILHSGR